jgi:hypothetical protein
MHYAILVIDTNKLYYIDDLQKMKVDWNFFYSSFRSYFLLVKGSW